MFDSFEGDRDGRIPTTTVLLRGYTALIVVIPYYTADQNKK